MTRGRCRASCRRHSELKSAVCWLTVREPVCRIRLWQASRPGSQSAAWPLSTSNFLAWSKGQSVQTHLNWLKQPSGRLWSQRHILSRDKALERVAMITEQAGLKPEAVGARFKMAVDDMVK